MLVDFHLHSYFSDGTDSPKEILTLARKINLDRFSITDHGCIESAKIFYDIPEFIPGVEINCYSNLGRDVHILGYNFDIYNAELNARLEIIQKKRLERVYQMIIKLNTLCKMNLSINRLKYLFPNTKSFGKPHIGYLIMDAGYTKSLNESFSEYLNYGKKGYVPRPKIKVFEAVDLIKRAGGIVSIAHPLSLNNPEKDFKILKLLGIDAVECYYSTYTESETEYLVETALKNRLLITGGTDYHGYLKEIKFCGIDIPSSRSGLKTIFA